MIDKIKNMFKNKVKNTINTYIVPYVEHYSFKKNKINKGDLVVLKSHLNKSNKKYGLVLTPPEDVVSNYSMLSDIRYYAKKRQIVRVLWNYNGKDFNNLEYCDNLELVQRKDE